MLELFPKSDRATLAPLIRERKEKFQTQASLALYHNALSRLKDRNDRFKTSFCDFSGDTIIIGKESELSPSERQELRDILKTFTPWRKGPFRVFGIDIDAEWRSDLKWNRLKPLLPELKDKIIADVGCNNGYYLFRMAHHEPKLAIGFDPVPRFHYTFQALNHLAARDNLQHELLGVEHLGLFGKSFDVIFLMGVLYHHPSPIDMLRDCFRALKPGGSLIVETQGISGKDPIALFPYPTYAKVKGTYFLPTATCLRNFLQKSWFKEIEILDPHPMSSAEQRRTEWSQGESYKDFISPNDPALTVEGYPAPVRVIARADKR